MAKSGYLLKMEIPVSSSTPFSFSFGESNSFRNVSSFRQVRAVPTDYKWRSYYFILRNGTLNILQSSDSTISDITFTLEQISEVKEIDSLLTGQQHSFQITLDYELDQRSNESEYSRTIVVNFLGQPVMRQTTISQPSNCDCKFNIVLSASTQEEQESWVRELSSAASGVKIRDNLSEFGHNALHLGAKVGVAGVSTMAVVAGAAVGAHVGASVGNRIGTRAYSYRTYRKK